MDVPAVFACASHASSSFPTVTHLLAHLLSHEHHPRVAGHRHPMAAVVDSFHRQVRIQALASSQPAPTPPRDLLLATRTDEDLYSLPVRFVSQTPLPSQYSCSFRLEKRDTRPKVPVVEVERLHDELFQKAFRKFQDAETARQLARTSERCSQRKRAVVDSPTGLLAFPAPASKRKRPESQSFVLSTPAVNRFKRRPPTFRPEGPVVNGLFRRLMNQETGSEFAPRLPESVVAVDSPFKTAPLFLGLSFQEVLELTEYSLLLDCDSLRSPCEEDGCIKFLLTKTAQSPSLDSPASASLACKTNTPASLESSEHPFKSPQSASLLDSPAKLEDSSCDLESEGTETHRHLRSVMVDEGGGSSADPASPAASEGTRDEALPTSRCRHCFNSELRLMPGDMGTHVSMTHRNCFCLPPPSFHLPP